MNTFKRNKIVLLKHDVKTNNVRASLATEFLLFHATIFLPSPSSSFSQERQKFISSTVHLCDPFGFPLMFSYLVS